MLAAQDIDGQSTFGMSSKGGGSIALDIRDGGWVVRGVRGEGGVDLLHVNCEGCEWEMLENIIKAGEHKHIRTIQFGSHYFPQVPGITGRYCRIREELNKTHSMVYGQAWAWERWDRR